MPRPPITSIRGLILLVAIAAIALSGFMAIHKAQKSEQRLREELQSERIRAQGYQRLARLAISQQGTPSIDLRRELDEETQRFQVEAARRHATLKETNR